MTRAVFLSLCAAALLTVAGCMIGDSGGTTGWLPAEPHHPTQDHP